MQSANTIPEELDYISQTELDQILKYPCLYD